MNTFIIFDTEFTSWKDSLKNGWDTEKGHFRELVQLAALKVNGQNLHVVDTFNAYAKPLKNPALSEYFKNLTGITQEDVDDANPPHKVISDFLEWCTNSYCYSYGRDIEILKENTVNTEVVIPENKFIDIKPFFENRGVPTDVYGSGKLHDFFNIKMGGHEHNALFDTKSILKSIQATLK